MLLQMVKPIMDNGFIVEYVSFGGCVMAKFKKMILGLSIVVTMVIAFVVGFAGLNQTKATNNTPNTLDCELTVPSTSQNKPATYNHAPNTINVKKGGDIINYFYSPDVNSMANERVVAYEYCFGSSDVDMAVDIKELDTTGVNVSYIYSNTQIDVSQAQTSFTEYELQFISTADRWRYIYVVVSAQNNIPTTFTQNVYWYYGKQGTIDIVNNINNSVISMQVLAGREVNRLDASLIPSMYHIYGLYLDSEYTIPVTLPISASVRTLYVEMGMLPMDYLELVDDQYVIVNGTSELYPELEIPSSVNKLPVTQILPGAFKGNETLTSVVIPSTVNVIAPDAFKRCNNVNSITLMDRTGWWINSGEGAMTPEELAASLNDPTMDITAPDVAAAFLVHLSHCEWFKSGNRLPNDWLKYDSVTLSYHITKGDSNLSGSIIIPATYDDGNHGELSVTHIDDNAFANSSIERVVIPTSLTYIGNNAFAGSRLGGLIIDSSDAYIAESAFSNCTNFKFIKLRYCDGLTEIDLSGCTNLISVEFYECGQLISANLSGCTRLIAIGEEAFRYNENLITVDLSGCTSLTSIGEYAFAGCSGLTSIDLSGCTSLASIGEYAFAGCSGLTSVDLSGYTSLTSIGEYAFNSCGGLTSITLPSSVESIGNNAFSYCRGLTSVDLSGCTSLTSIGSDAFYYCSGLTSIVIPANVTKIGTFAFYGCSALNSITFSDTTTWYCGTIEQQNAMSGGTQINVNTPSTNATYFKSTHYLKYWYKI